MTPRFLRSLLPLAACACLLPAAAQTLTGVTLDPPSGLEPGKPFNVQLHFAPVDGKPAWCGVSVDFGDGTITDRRIEDIAGPVVLQHTYGSAGNFQVKVEGRNMTRGLRSAVACEGRQEVAVAITDLARQKRIEEAREQRRKERDEARKRQAEQRELEARQREVAMKERELREREEALKAREAAARRAAARAAQQQPRKETGNLDVFK